MRVKKQSEWHLKVLRALADGGKIISNSMETYINLRFDGYVQWGGDGEVYLTDKGWEATRSGVCLMTP